jgi:DUF4097 and DUF4098 domain-containing protein YvlB
MHEFHTPTPISARLSLLVAGVRVDASARDTTTVELRPSDPNDPRDVEMVQRTEVEFEDGALSVRSPRSLRSFKPRGSIEVHVQLPTGSSVRAETATGSFRATGTLGKCRIDTAAGEIAIERARIAKISKAAGQVTIGEVDEATTIESATGEIRIDAIGGSAKIANANGDAWIGAIEGDLKITGANGDIVVERCGGSVSASTALGAVRLLSAAQGRIKVDSARGDIEIGIAEGTAAWLNLNTTFGRARSELDAADAPVEHERTVEVSASTAFGDITVRRAQPTSDGEPSLLPA